jgi:hypothetical protein
MACEIGMLRCPPSHAIARRYRQAIEGSNPASAFAASGSSSLTAASADKGHEPGLLSGSQNVKARINNLIHVESCPNNTQGLP